MATEMSENWMNKTVPNVISHHFFYRVILVLSTLSSKHIMLFISTVWSLGDAKGLDVMDDTAVESGVTEQDGVDVELIF